MEEKRQLLIELIAVFKKTELDAKRNNYKANNADDALFWEGVMLGFAEAVEYCHLKLLGCMPAEAPANVIPLVKKEATN